MKKEFYKLIIIDFDETLVKYIKDADMKNPTLTWLRNKGIKDVEKVFSPGIWNNYDLKLKYLGIDADEFEKKWRPVLIKNEFKNKKNLLERKKIILNEGVIEFLKQINIPLVLISNGNPNALDLILNHFKIRKYFSHVHKRTYDNNDLKKPDPELGKKIMGLFGINNPAEIVMIGDSEEDMLFAKNMGLKFYNIFYRQKECYRFFNNFFELIDYLNKFHKREIKL